MSDLSVALPKGSRVLVTGLGGFLASHVAKQLLDRGYKVRGTVRDPSANAWITDEMFADATQRGDLELVALDFTTASPSTYESAVKGVDGVLHVAAIQTFDPNPDNVIPHVVGSVTALLKAASQEPTVKRFVYTSSSVAAFMPNPFSDETIMVRRDSWNDAALAAVQTPQPNDPRMGGLVYMASKAAAEKALWKFAAEDPPFVVNVVSPYTLIGPILHKSFVDKNLPSWVNQLYHGKVDYIQHLPARKSRMQPDLHLASNTRVTLSLLCQRQRRSTSSHCSPPRPRGSRRPYPGMMYSFQLEHSSVNVAEEVSGEEVHR